MFKKMKKLLTKPKENSREAGKFRLGDPGMATNSIIRVDGDEHSHEYLVGHTTYGKGHDPEGGHKPDTVIVTDDHSGEDRTLPMSRHGFFKVLHDPNEAQEDITDLVGYDLYDWLGHGVAGYDDSLETFFFNLEGSWIFGTEKGEIPNIGMMQAILSAIFRGEKLPFNEEGLRSIAIEVERSPAVLMPHEAADLSSSISASYLEQKVALANLFRGESDSLMSADR